LVVRSASFAERDDGIPPLVDLLADSLAREIAAPAEKAAA